MTFGDAPRTLPRGLAAVVEQMELDQATLITTAELAVIASRAGIQTPSRIVAARLRERGWLLPTDRRGVYEFAPGSHAGALSSGQTTLPLQALLRARPGISAGLTMQSAAWALGLADRAPQRLEIAIQRPVDATQVIDVSRVIHALHDIARITRFTPQLPMGRGRGVPLLLPESVLIQMVTRPSDVRSWSSTLEWLPDLAAELTVERLRTELMGRPRAATARAAYLLSGLRPDLVEQLPTKSGHGVVYFGPRSTSRRYDSKLQIIDTALPFDPRNLDPALPDATRAAGVNRRVG